MQKEHFIEENVTKLLLAIGIPINLQGFRYLRQAIKIVINDNEILGRITKGLYPAVADYFGVTPIVIERGMRHAVDVAYHRHTLVALNDFFDVDVYDTRIKPTNSEVIALIAERVTILLRQAGFEDLESVDMEAEKRQVENNDKNDNKK